MKWALWLLVLFSVAVAVTLAARYNSGYVLVVAQPYRLELSLNLMAVLLLALFFLTYFIVRLAVITLRLPAEVKEFRSRRRREKARSAMLDGLKAFFEGSYAKAEKSSAAALELKESPAVSAISALVAARSAHELRKYTRRDEFIAIAESIAPKEITARLMTQAELLLDEHRPEEALKILRSLHTAGTRQHAAALRLELKAQRQLKNWDAVLSLLSQLEQLDATDITRMKQLRRHAHVENLKSRTLNPQALQEYWQNTSSTDKKDNKVAAVAARAAADAPGRRARLDPLMQSRDLGAAGAGQAVGGAAGKGVAPTEFELSVLVPVTSLCPCSKAISDYGAHNQRSHVSVNAVFSDPACVQVDELIRAVEQQASCELWGLLKRTDEKFVTERAYENPKFVEDLVRDVAEQVKGLPGVLRFRIEAENFESIHNHSAYAVIEG